MSHRSAWMLAAVTLLLSGLAGEAADPGFKVVVHETNPVSSVNKQQLSRCFMKELKTWSSGHPVIPVDQTASALVREEFSKSIHGRDANAVKSFWQRQIFSGRGVPPPELASDREVLDFVRANPGAVGYVSSSANPGDGVKVLAVTE
jgi:ABC-type phosphate transport system substrate-binding protein